MWISCALSIELGVHKLETATPSQFVHQIKKERAFRIGGQGRNRTWWQGMERVCVESHVVLEDALWNEGRFQNATRLLQNRVLIRCLWLSRETSLCQIKLACLRKWAISIDPVPNFEVPPANWLLSHLCLLRLLNPNNIKQVNEELTFDVDVQCTVRVHRWRQVYFQQPRFQIRVN